MAGLDDRTEILPAAGSDVDPGNPDATMDSASAPPRPPADGDLVGRTLGKFTVLEKLGRGGSGDVYRAEQQQLGRSAVIKVLRRGGAVSTTKIDRFLREAKLASRLDHPYAAHVYAFGVEPDGELWIAMEHVRGATLDELVNRRGPIPPVIFAALFARICEVVHTAHELGIVHRDLKGSNVMVIERAGQLLPKLLDFGIAKADGAELDLADGSFDGDDRDLTQQGATLGSPHYMSPEQWERPADVDARSDIYALGVLAYRCLAGVVPFRIADRALLVDAHLHQPPPRLPDDVPEPLAAAVYRALEKAPAARWTTALALGEAVRHAVGGAAAEAVPLFDPYTRDVWLRAGPQPIADAIARLADASTAVDFDAAIRELVNITCRWLAVLALATLRGGVGDAEVKGRAREVVGRDDAQPWLELARTIARAHARAVDTDRMPGLTAALIGSDALAALAERLDDREPGHAVRTAQSLALDVATAADALRPLEPLLAYQLVVGRGAQWAESWIGTRRRERERVLVWGDPLDDGDVALLDAAGKVVARLSPLAQVIAPLPSAEPEMFLLWRGGRGAARLVAAPWGFEVDDDVAGARLALLTTEDGETTHDAIDDVSPYPGLAAYREADADRFVGREREIEALVNRLVRAPLLAVLGPSGAGKSSFIHAGVVPRLESSGYRVVTTRPGRHPLHALASLPPVSADSQDDTATAARLRELGEAAPGTSGSGARGLVVVVDQLEELVTLCGDAGERTRFAETLAAAADGPRAPVRVIVTLRDDFAAVIESEQALRGRFEVFVLGTPLPEALRRIVVEPARGAGVAVDAAVVDDMVAEVAGRPASLPLLSFTAAQLWRTRDKQHRTITRAAYDALGGVAGALSTYADQVYDSLPRHDQQVIRTVFARLVAGDGTRIPAPRGELEQLPGAAPVLAHLVDARLLVVREDDGVDTIEIVHECLAERWERLARWRREDAVDRALVADLRGAARRWLDTGHRADVLWRGEALAELRRLVGRAPALTDAERAFAAASDTADRRARRLRRGALAAAMAALAAIAVVMAYLGADAKQSRDEAQASAAEARTTAKLADDRLTAGLVAQGTAHLNDGRELQALAFFAEAMRRGADSVGLREMIAVASRGWRDDVLDLSGISAIAALPDGGVLAANRDGTVHWIDPTGKLTGDSLDLGLGVPRQFHLDGDRVTVVAQHGVATIAARCCRILGKLAHDGLNRMAAALDADADEIAIEEQEGVLVYGKDGIVRRRVAVFEPQFGEATFDAGARHVLAWSDGSLAVVDPRTMATRELARDMYHDGVLSEDRRTFAYLDSARAVHVIAGDGTTIATFRPSVYAESVAVSATGDRIAAVGDDGLAVADRTGKELYRIALDVGQGTALVDGDDLWTASRTGVVRRFHAGVLVASDAVHVGDLTDARHAGALIATLDSDEQLAVTRADAMQFRPTAPPCPRTAEWAFADAQLSVCKDGRYLAYRGRRLIGALVGVSEEAPTVAYDDASGEAVVASDAVTVYGRDATMLETSTRVRAEDVSFEDAGHVVVLEHGDHGALWRWTWRDDRWDRLMDAPRGIAVVVTPHGTWLAYQDGHVVVLDGTREIRRYGDLGRVSYFVATRDGAHLAMQLVSGATVIADTATGAIERKLPPADASDNRPDFDDTGELILRPANGFQQIFDRRTLEPLVFGLDLLRGASGAVFGPRGSLELQGPRTGVIDIARDDRPAAAIIADIGCHVPLAVVDGRLEAAARRCAR